MFRTRRHWSADLVVAVLAAVAATAARAYLSHTIGDQISILIFVPAIAFSAWFGGFVPGIVTTVLSLVAHLFVTPDLHQAVPVDTRAEEIRLILLAGTGVLISSLYGSLRYVRRGLEKRYDRATITLQAAERLSGTLVVDEIHEGLRQLILRALPADGILISSYDPDTRVARCVCGWVSGRPFDPTSLPELVIDLDGPGMQTEVIRTGKARLFADVRARVKRPGRYYDVGPDGVKDLSRPGAGPPGARCALMAPVKLEGRVMGIVQVMCDTPGTYRREHLAVLEAIVAPIAVALQNAELYARAKREIAERLRVEQALTLSEERLLEADRRKDEFLATLAHELRNPLSPIQNAVGLMRSRGADAAQISWSGQVIERQVGHMARLLDDLLDVSRVSRGRLRLRKTRVDLAEVVRNAVEACHPLIESGRHPLTLRFPPEPILLDADGTRVAQVFSNLLNNAVRYSEAESPIDLYATCEGGEAVVRVTDHGIGIPAAMLARVFEAFLQIDRSLERSQGGLGIGLTLVKQIVELHGGRVEAASDGVGKGSAFTVRLPLPVPDGAEPAAPGPIAGAIVPEIKAAPASEKPARIAAEPKPDKPARIPADPKPVPSGAPAGVPPDLLGGRHERKRILVADDLEDSATSLSMLLELQGHEVRTAYDGDEAVRVAREFRPDIVLLDIAMPKKNGYEAARQIVAERGEDRPVLIAITGWGHEENRMRTKEAGFDYHLVKPVEPDALIRMLHDLETGRSFAIDKA